MNPKPMLTEIANRVAALEFEDDFALVDAISKYGYTTTASGTVEDPKFEICLMNRYDLIVTAIKGNDVSKLAVLRIGADTYSFVC